MNDIWKQKSSEIFIEDRAKYFYELLVRKELHVPCSTDHRVKITIIISHLPVLYVEYYVHSRKLSTPHILQYSVYHLPKNLTLVQPQLVRYYCLILLHPSRFVRNVFVLA